MSIRELVCLCVCTRARFLSHRYVVFRARFEESLGATLHPYLSLIVSEEMHTILEDLKKT